MAGNSEDPETLFFKYNLYENACNLKRGEEIPIKDLIHEFENNHLKLKEEGIWGPDYIAGFMLLSSCRLPEEKIFMVMSAIYSEVNYDSMKTAILTVLSQEIDTDDTSSSEEESVCSSRNWMNDYKENNQVRKTNWEELEMELEVHEDEETDGGQKQKRLRLDTSLNISEGMSNKKKKRVRLNRRTSICLWCDAPYRWCWKCKCRNREERNQESMRPLIFNRKMKFPSLRKTSEIQFMLFASCESDDVNLNDLNDQQELIQELRGCAILDSGCPITVCGQAWLDRFRGDMSDEECLQVKIELSNQKFMFGDRRIVVSKKRITVPCWIGEMRDSVCMEVVDCNIPLILGKKEMKEKEMVVDFGKGELIIGNRIIKLGISRSGHYALPIYRSE